MVWFISVVSLNAAHFCKFAMQSLKCVTIFISMHFNDNKLLHTFHINPSLRNRGIAAGGHSLRHMGMCHPNLLLFHQKFLDICSILVQKILSKGPYFTKNCKRLVESAIVEVEKPLEMGPIYKNLKKKKKEESNQPCFEGEKSLDMDRDFKPRTTSLLW